VKNPASPTALLEAWGRGDRAAFDALVPLVHDELKRIARRHMHHERGEHTLQPSALVNEACIGRLDVTRIEWQNRAHFFAMAARVMRRILVDSARARKFQKRGGGAQITLEGTPRAQNFFRVDLRSGQRRQLTDLKAGVVIQNFDVSPDGTHIVFDRVRNHSDIVVMNLAR
jgi:RNA polymerase sigma factor (TIGR02999 family)